MISGMTMKKKRTVTVLHEYVQLIQMVKRKEKTN